MARKLLGAALALMLSLTFASTAWAADTITLPAKGKATPPPEGFAVVKVTYTCDPREGETYMDMSVVQTITDETGTYTVSDFDHIDGLLPLTCDGRKHKVTQVMGADSVITDFATGPATVCAGFWNTLSSY